MSRFSPSDVALEGFRLTRERPLAVLAWALVRIAFAVVTVLAVASVGGDALSKLAALQQGAVKISDAEATRLLSRSLPALGLTLLLNFAVYALVYTAAMRAIFRPADKAFAYLRLSADEVRQFILALLTTVVFFALAFLLVVVTVVIWSLADALGPIGVTLRIVAVMFAIGICFYTAVRLSLAPAMTFMEGRISLFRSAALTRAQFWPMFGAYVLAFALTFIVAILAAIIFMFGVGAIGLAEGGVAGLTSMLGVMQSQDLSLNALFTPIRVANLVFSAVISTLAYLIMFSPTAAIFRDLAGATRVVGSIVETPGTPWS